MQKDCIVPLKGSEPFCELDALVLGHIQAHYCAMIAAGPRQVICLSDVFASTESCETDGNLGSALVNEIKTILTTKKIACDREQIKLSLIRCLYRLKSQVHESHYTRQYQCSLKPIGIRPNGAERINQLALKAIAALPAPLIQEICLYAGGEFWWGRASSKALPLDNTHHQSFTIVTDQKSIRRFFQRLLPFACTRMQFSMTGAIYLEWSSTLERIWIRASSCHVLIQLCRFLRHQNKQRKADFVSVQGHGYAMI